MAGCRRRPPTTTHGSVATRVFVVDPIDGTRAFLAGGQEWTISLAVVEAGRPVVAVLVAPALEIMFHARRRGRRLRRRRAGSPAGTRQSLAGARFASTPALCRAPSRRRARRRRRASSPRSPTGSRWSRAARSTSPSPRPTPRTGTLRQPIFWCTKPGRGWPTSRRRRNCATTGADTTHPTLIAANPALLGDVVELVRSVDGRAAVMAGSDQQDGRHKASAAEPANAAASPPGLRRRARRYRQRPLRRSFRARYRRHLPELPHRLRRLEGRRPRRRSTMPACAISSSTCIASSIPRRPRRRPRAVDARRWSIRRDQRGQAELGRGRRAARPRQSLRRRPRRSRAASQRLSTRILAAPPFQRGIAGLAANYLRFVNRTSPLVFDPAGRLRALHPPHPGDLHHVARAAFHAALRPHLRLRRRACSSRAAATARSTRASPKKLGVEARSAARPRATRRAMMEKGGMVGFLEMKAALEEGACVSMTADISNLAARRAGLGIVTLARASGRPIVPIAYATSRRIDVKSWDRATINLPFSRAVVAVGEPVHRAGGRRRCASSRRSGSWSRPPSTRRRRAPIASSTGAMADASPRRRSSASTGWSASPRSAPVTPLLLPWRVSKGKEDREPPRRALRPRRPRTARRAGSSGSTRRASARPTPCSR